MLLRNAEVLVVEDNYLLAEMIREALVDAGAVVQVEATSSGALAYLSDHLVAVASLDFELAEGTSEPVADALVRAGIPFAFFSGYLMRSNRHPDAPWVVKPHVDRLIEVLSATG